MRASLTAPPLPLRRVPGRGRAGAGQRVRADRGFLRWLPLVVERAGIPYGYTLTIWSAGALCIRRFGLPNLADVFLFAVGGTIGYALLALGTRRGRQPAPPAAAAAGAQLPGPLWENIVALPAIAVAAGVSVLVPGAGPNFLVVPLIATMTYLAGLAALVSLTAAAQRARSLRAREARPRSGREQPGGPGDAG
jgi:hypothetical protein